MSRRGPAVVLVPGAWHDATSWRAVEWHLSARRIPSISVDLPSTDPVVARAGNDGAGALPGFAADVAAVLDRLDAIEDEAGGEVVLCGHGYGGMVISEAGHHRSVRRLVYLTALCPPPGRAAVDLVPALRPGRGRRGRVRLLGDGRAELSGRPARRLAAEGAWPGPSHRRWDAGAGRWRAEPSPAAGTGLRPFTAAILWARVGRPAWLDVPTVHVRARRDPVFGVRPGVEQAHRVLSRELAWGWPPIGDCLVPTGHRPLVSTPGLVAGLLAAHREAVRTGRETPPLPWPA